MVVPSVSMFSPQCFSSFQCLVLLFLDKTGGVSWHFHDVKVPTSESF